MELKTIKLFTFEELEETIKKKIINQEKEALTEMRGEYLSDELYCQCFDKYKIDCKNLDLNYSFSYSQGDGVSFEMDEVLNYDNIKNNKDLTVFDDYIIKTYKNTDLFDEVLEIIENINFKLERINTYYSHKFTCKMYWNEKEENSSFYLNQDFINKIKNDLYNIYKEVCDYLEEFGYSFLEISDDEVVEYLKDEDDLYFKNGDVYSEAIYE